MNKCFDEISEEVRVAYTPINLQLVNESLFTFPDYIGNKIVTLKNLFKLILRKNY